MDRETEVEAEDGRKVSISLSAALLHEPLGEPVGAVAVVLDITHRKAAEEERARAYDQIGRNIEQFAVLVDSIRNPLTVIVGRADMGYGEDMRIIADQAERIESIIKRLDKGWIESEKVRQLLKKGV
jgi:signal transduction histidine kinase